MQSRISLNPQLKEEFREGEAPAEPRSLESRLGRAKLLLSREVWNLGSAGASPSQFDNQPRLYPTKHFRKWNQSAKLQANAPELHLSAESAFHPGNWCPSIRHCDPFCRPCTVCSVENAEHTTILSKAKNSWFHLSGHHEPACDINPPGRPDRRTNHSMSAAIRCYQ